MTEEEKKLRDEFAKAAHAVILRDYLTLNDQLKHGWRDSCAIEAYKHADSML